MAIRVNLFPEKNIEKLILKNPNSFPMGSKFPNLKEEKVWS